jgi:5-methylthioadenosine/S-adenosylhomocysteine deaminase
MLIPSSHDIVSGDWRMINPWRYGFDHIFPAESNHFTPNRPVRHTSGLCRDDPSGNTTCCDGYFLEDEVARGAVLIPVCGQSLGQGIIDFPATGVPNPSDNVKTREKSL